MEHLKFPEFVKVKGLFKTDSGFIKAPIKINPIAVSFYHPSTVEISGKEKGITSIYVSGGYLYVDMSYEEFDSFWGDVKRNFEMNEPLF